MLPSDATEVVLARHGSSRAHAGQPGSELLDGQSDPPITEEGRRQADAIARRLVRAPVAAVFVTPLRRTIETAEPLATALALTPTVVADLREVRLGDWEGGVFERRTTKPDPLLARVFDEERWDLIPGAEPMADFASRVHRGLESIAAGVGPGAVAVAFVHGGVVAEACRQATASRGFAFIGVENGSMTRLVRGPTGEWWLRSFNETSHLVAHDAALSNAENRGCRLPSAESPRLNGAFRN